MIFNKITGFYGLLAIFTGFELSLLQLSMYIYSVAALGLISYLMPHIRKQSPFHNLALAWFYLIDTIINTAYTSAFAMTWVFALGAQNVPSRGIPGVPGSITMDQAAGITSLKHNTSELGVMASPASGVTKGQDVVASAAVGQGVGFEETIPSLILIAIMTLIRVYFILIVMAYARQVLRQHIYSRTSVPKLHLQNDGVMDVPAENPFAENSLAGRGWKGKLGRAMVKLGESYWLGTHNDDSWAKGLDGKFKSTKNTGPPGTFERERRARSGTGPPLPPKNLPKL